MITIENIHIEEIGKYSRLCACIKVDGEIENTVWYEVEKRWAQYLCDECADAFVVGILPFAMAFKHDIAIVGKPVSEKMYWQLTQIYISSLEKFSNYYKKIKIQCSLCNIKWDSFAVGTGFSAGVDSFYTFYKNHEAKTKQHNITHLTFFNVGACGSYGGDQAFSRFKKRISLFKGFAEENGVEFITVNSNISEFLMMSFNYTHSFRSISAVLALQKLFKVYYYSAGVTLDEFSFNPSASDFYDLLSVQSFQTESVSFYSTGGSENRIEKLEYISKYPSTYSLLNVCNENDTNCSTCEKCIRTMSALYAIGQLDKYYKVFDVPYFYKHLAYNMAFVMSKKYDGTPEATFCNEIIKKCERQHVLVPKTAHIVAIPLSAYSILYGTARKIKPLRRIVHNRIAKKRGVRFNDE